MTKKISLILTLLLLLIPTPYPAEAYDTASAQSYLLDHADNPWSTMALSVLGAPSIPTAHLKSVNGSSAIEYAAPILAIAALNQDPRTFGSADYVSELKTYHSGGQIGDESLLNDDIFGILALIAAGEPVSDQVVADAQSFILTNQNPNGGWGFTVSSSSDTNMTAAAILALLASGGNSSDSAVTDALGYLQSVQNDDGGFPYDPQSSFSTDSDSASTAWVMWALNALDQDTSAATTYLEINQTSQGFFEYQPGSDEDSFSAITTAYAVIALEGKTLPVNIFSGTSSELFDFRIEGSSEQVCAGKTLGPTALDIVKNASSLCGFSYTIQDTSFGPYLSQINDDEAQGLTGWLYFVNNMSPNVGAADYVLESGDSALWYYGDFGWQPTRLTLSEIEIATTEYTTATVEFYEGNQWQPLVEAEVFYGTQSVSTDVNGQATISPPDGFYRVHADKEGFIRSNQILLKVGDPTSASVSLGVIVDNGDVDGTQTPPPDTIAFTVNPDSADFGVLTPGSEASQEITVTNTGSTDIFIGTTLAGDDVFRNNLQIGGTLWQNFETELIQSEAQVHQLKLALPINYPGASGEKQGNLTFWAIAK